jgi:hypothetical protein
MNEWHETSMARRNPSREQSANRPWRSLLRRKGDGVEREIERFPAVLYRLKYRFHLAGLANVAG